jgi:hypothetical protein
MIQVGKDQYGECWSLTLETLTAVEVIFWKSLLSQGKLLN